MDTLQNAGPITQDFGAFNPQVEKFSGGVNRGTDVQAPKGSEVTVPEGKWTVVESFGDSEPTNRASNKGYGNSVLLRNLMSGEMLRFSHLTNVTVRPGQVVEEGTPLGSSGETGNATGPHLDIEYMDARGRLKDVQESKYAV